ncbi:hypothetical protein [Leucobacter aridicollis]|uniref:Uncharacterized protein n=1 Tax=Leucobacter aridicollis TaxID=283878 RepID=A0A852RHV5_9MICO|nr:hypothetical protein [Leucobacter aridicollis]MBL3682814.1 hypothetical protein [Leucobacter aridicollis]NYD26252.1 hypothetical protein [Leucobacter aridicollis]
MPAQDPAQDPAHNPAPSPPAIPHAAEQYLARLDVAVERLPHGIAAPLRDEISAELTALPPGEVAARIAELGAPEAVAAAALAAATSDPDTRDTRDTLDSLGTARPAVSGQAAPQLPLSQTRGYAIAAAITFGIGGIVVPLVGWVVGCVLVGTSGLWRRGEKVAAFAAPCVVAAVLCVALWLVRAVNLSSAQSGSSEPLTDVVVETATGNPLLPAGYDLVWSGIVILFFGLIPLTALWLVLRLRGRSQPAAALADAPAAGAVLDSAAGPTADSRP